MDALVKASLLNPETGREIASFRLADGERVVLGRSERADVRVSAQGVSRAHCTIARAGDKFVIEDLRSHNGTWVNGERVERGTLRPGDRIRLGVLEAEFQALAAPAAPSGHLADDTAADELDVLASPVLPAAPASGRTPPEDRPAADEEDWEAALLDAGDAGERAAAVSYWVRRRRRQTSSNLAWWGVSFVLHVVLLLLLGQLSLQQIPPKKKRIEIKAEIVELTERLRPIRRQVLNMQQLARPAGAQGQPFNELLASTRRVAPMAVLGAVNAAQVNSLFASANAGMFDRRGGRGGDAVARVRKAAAKNYDEAIDDFAMEMIDHLEKKDLLVVLLFDQSKSLENDRQLMMAKLESVTKALDENLDERSKKRLKWSVVSFGRSRQILLRPTSDIPKVKAAISDVQIDPSGEENVISALRYVLRTYASLRKPTFIVLITDEAGTDIDDHKRVEATIAALKTRQFRVFVFGREAVFANRQATEIYEGAPVLVDKGPESPEPEFFPSEGRAGVFTAYHDVPSGFAMYIQGRLAAATGGECYLLASAASPYDEARLEEMRPELCSLAEYEAHTRASTVRRTLQFIVKTWPSKRPALTPSGGRTAAANAMRQAAAARQWCSEAIRRLKKLRSKRGRASKYSPKRWRANFDLIYAQLHKFRFMLRQYAAALQRGGLDAPPIDAEGHELVGFALRVDKTRPLGKDRELPKVRALFDDIINTYPRTPWAAVAKAERDALAAVVAVPRYRIPPKPGEAPPKPPPKL